MTVRLKSNVEEENSEQKEMTEGDGVRVKPSITSVYVSLRMFLVKALVSLAELPMHICFSVLDLVTTETFG